MTDGKNHITISNSASNSAASRFALAQQNYSQAEYEFEPEELVQMKEKTLFELRRERRQKQGDVMKSPFIQAQLKNIRFFPDPTLNRLMSRLLQRLHYVKEALRVTMYIFFDVAMFKEYYVPSPSGPSGISNNKPFPKYERFHAFWSSIHCNDTAFCAKYTKGCIDANSNYRKIALTGGEYTGYVSHRSNATSSFEVTKSSPIDAKGDTLPQKRSILEAPSSSKRYQITLSPTAKSSKSSCNPQRTLVANQVNHDSNGHAFFRTSDGDTCYTKDPKSLPITADRFYNASRLLLMKARAQHIWVSIKTKLLESRDLCWFSGASMADVADKVENFNHFPDAYLNQLMKKLINHNISLTKVVKITIYVFYSAQELTKESIPPSLTFERVSRPPVLGYELFHEFWNYLYDTNRSSERRKRFDSAFSEAQRLFTTPGTFPELPF